MTAALQTCRSDMQGQNDRGLAPVSERQHRGFLTTTRPRSTGAADNWISLTFDNPFSDRKRHKCHLKNHYAFHPFAPPISRLLLALILSTASAYFLKSGKSTP
jgi:hypothetical protein